MYAPAGVKISKDFPVPDTMKAWVLGDPGELKLIDKAVPVAGIVYAPAIGRMGGEAAPTLRDHLRRSHTVTEDVGLVAARAGVKKLVLSHLVPADPAITDDMWLAGVRKNFAGEAVVGKDLMEV